MTNTLLAEWIKIRTVLAHKILAIAAFAFPLIIVTLAATFGDVAEGPDSAEMAEFIFAMCVVSAMLLGVVTVIGLTSEYTHNTIRPTYAATPARQKVLFAKLIVSTGVAIAVDALAVIVTWLSGSTIFNSRGGKTAIGDPNVVTVLVCTVVLAALVTWFGFGMGLLLRNSPASVSLLLLWPLLIEGMITLFLALVNADDAAKYLPYRAAFEASAANVDESALGRPAGQLLFAAVAAALVGVGMWLDSRRDA